VQKYKEEKVAHITEKALYNIVEDVCTFILKYVIPCEGKYHDVEGVNKGYPNQRT